MAAQQRKIGRLKTIGMEFKTISKLKYPENTITEVRHFISNVTEISDFARAIREHWGVENGLHWHLDFTFKDDKNTTMANNGAKNLQIFKKLALAILKFAQPLYPKRTGLKLMRFYLCTNFENEVTNIFKMMDVDKLAEK